MRDVVEPPWLDHRMTFCNGKRCQVFLIVVAPGRALTIEQTGRTWRHLHEGYVLSDAFLEPWLAATGAGQVKASL